MKNWDSFVVGIFFGFLLISVFMLNWPKAMACEVTVGHGMVSHVSIGVLVDEQTKD